MAKDDDSYGGPMSDTDVLLAVATFVEYLAECDGPFKIGRSDEEHVDDLKHREMYEGDPTFRSIWTGTAEVCEWLEKLLIRIAFNVEPDRCVNQQVGGGGIGDSTKHHVYFVAWPKTQQNGYRAVVRRALRELGL
jgi:hypothetical protein